LTLLATSTVAAPISFVATGILENGSILSGDVIIDPTVGTVNAANLTLTGPFSFTVSDLIPLLLGPNYFEVANFDGNSITVVLPIASFVGYGGGNFKLSEPGVRNTTARTGKGGPISNFASGGLTATPEPATATLVGGALAVLIGLRFRRA
jgi:hypothetical protein